MLEWLGDVVIRDGKSSCLTKVRVNSRGPKGGWREGEGGAGSGVSEGRGCEAGSVSTAGQRAAWLLCADWPFRPIRTMHWRRTPSTRSLRPIKSHSFIHILPQLHWPNPDRTFAGPKSPHSTVIFGPWSGSSHMTWFYCTSQIRGPMISKH